MNMHRRAVGVAGISILLVVVAGITPGARAADAQGNYLVWGMGQASCHAYLGARDAGDAGKYRTFLMGYLTAANAITAQSYSVTGDVGIDTILGQIDEYCRDHRIESFERAIGQATIVLRPSGRTGAAAGAGAWTR